ncbi:MAG: tetratricopeptide repeat protein [Planctomycetota bacterium]
MTRLRLLAAFALPLLAHPLLAQQDERPAAGKPDAAAVRQSVEAWARTFEKALREDQPDEVEGFLDVEAIMDATLDGVEVDNASVLKGFRAGMKGSMGTANRTLWTQWAASQPKFKQVLLIDGKPSARFRFCGENGISILDLRLRKDGDTWRVADVYNHAFGLGMVDQMRSTAALMLKGLDAGVIARLFGAEGVSPKDGSRVADMTRKMRQGDYQGAMAVYARLSKAMQQTQMVTALHVQSLSMIESESDAYVAALEDAARRFPAPQFRLTLIDAHFLKERWDAAVGCIDDCMKAVGRDAVLLTLRALMLLQADRKADAIADLKEAVSLEPDCEYVLSTGLDVWLAAKDWKAVANAIRKLEATGEYDFKGQLQGEQWAGFAAAEESKPWR